MKKQALISVAVLVLLSLAATVSGGTGDLEETLKTFLKKHYSWQEIEISELELNAPAPQAPPAEIRIVQSPPGRTVFRLEYEGGRTIKATALVKAYNPVVMSRKQLKKGDVLQKTDVYAVLADATKIPKGAYKNEEAVIGKPLSRSIGVNLAITESMLQEAPLLKKGQKVMLVIDAPGLTVKAVGALNQNAAIGNQVKVVNLVSHKVVTGLLVDEHTVKVGL